MASAALHTTTIEYTTSKKFKITITADDKLRIKIPQNMMFTQEEKDWILMCHVALKLFDDVDHPCTLRGHITISKRGVTSIETVKTLTLRNHGRILFKVDFDDLKVISMYDLDGNLIFEEGK